MRIFQDEPWKSKVNFVDKVNRFVGYDTDQLCCEKAGWFIADSPQDRIIKKYTNNRPQEMPGWMFDPDFFRKVSNREHFRSGGMVIFRLLKGGDEKYLHLFNCQNGYYSHGFTSGVGDTVERDECI